MKSLSALLLSALCASTCFAQNKADSLKAAAIFNKSKEAYAHLKTYVDDGRAITTNDKNNNTQTVVFKTAYVNNGNFNFEYYVAGTDYSLYQINRVGKQVKTWWGVTKKQEVVQSLSKALGAATGVSSSTSYIVPRFLLPADFDHINFYALQKHIALQGSEKVDGIDCFKITTQWANGPTLVWIAKQDYLIRKIEFQLIIDPAVTEATTRKDIAYRKAKHMDYSSAEKALKIYGEIRKRDSLSGHPMVPFKMHETIMYSPTVNGKLKSDWFKFKPNRVAGS